METHVLMGTDVFWTALEQTGLEQLHLVENETGAAADGLVLGSQDAVPFRLWYRVQTDSNWNVRECLFQVGGAQGKTARLVSDGRGHWTDAEGVACPALDGCLDIDITCTPFTNTLPIRRLALAPGESAELRVAYITVPDLSIRPVRQRYTCLSREAAGGVYRYEGLDSNFTADLPVDAQGLVIDYPGLWKRAEGRAEAASLSSPPGAVLEGLLASGPRPELADKLRLFGQFVGDWDVDWTGYQPDSTVAQQAKGEIHFAWVLAGRAIQDVWIFPTRADQQRGLPVDEWGSTLRFYDPGTDMWKISWHAPVNNFTRAMTARPVGDEIWVEGANFQGQPLRWVFSQITSRSFRWTNFVSEDDGQTWRVQEELAAQRRGPHTRL
ncbi:MAG TPA: putative glycolipid-binding domain-containing protein [Ktedonobacterales bacterium]|jgi:hypothetical protein